MKAVTGYNTKPFKPAKQKYRYSIIKSIDYHFIDREINGKMSFYKDDGNWKRALNEMSRYIRKKKINPKEIYFAPSLSKYEKKTLLEKIRNN